MAGTIARRCAGVLGALLFALPAHALYPHIIISTGSHAVFGSVTVENEDLAACEATSLGENTTTCTWTHLFDGSAAGLNTSIRAVDLLPNGNLVMAVDADGSIPDLSAIKTPGELFPPFTLGLVLTTKHASVAPSPHLASAMSLTTIFVGLHEPGIQMT